MRKLFRFSLLELLWMCGVLAIFLGLNLQTTAFTPDDFIGDHSNSVFLRYIYYSEAGWPFTYLSLFITSPQEHSYHSPELTEGEIRRAFEVEMKDMPDLVPGTYRPSFESAWQEAFIDPWSIFYNVLVALCAAVLPLGLVRWVRTRAPKVLLITPESGNILPG